MAKGKFIAFEGCDGSGKTTVSEAVAQNLRERGYDVIYTREPGGIDIAEQIRKVILDPENTAMDNRTEALLYAASRRQHLVEKVIPALEAGKIVISDRYVLSSLAYQGYARGIGVDEVLSINQFAINNLWPDRTIYLDVDPEIGLQRISSRKNLDRLDQEAADFHHLVHDGYQLVKERYADNITSFDASLSVEEVIRNVTEYLLSIL